MEARSATREFTVASLHPGVTLEKMQETCGWPVTFADHIEETPPPTELELTTLRDLQAQTKAAHELYDCAQGHWLCRKGVGFRYRRGFCVVRFGAQRGRSSFVA